jgi:hypothetical protein
VEPGRGPVGADGRLEAGAQLLAGSHRFSELQRGLPGIPSIAHALGGRSVALAGRSDLRRAFGGWIGLSPFAGSRP